MEKDNKNTKAKQNLYPEILETLKQNIRNIRKEKGFRSAESFAEELDVSLKTVQGWENLDNGRWPDLAMMIHLCEKTGCDLDFLLGRMKEPTHGIKYVCDQTGFSVEAVEKLTSLRGTGLDDLLSEIITHKNTPRLLRLLLLASDTDEISWMDLDELPSGLLSRYADKTPGYDLTAGIGPDIADFLASQELTNVIRSIREKREKDYINKRQNDVRYHYDVFKAMLHRKELNERIEDAIDFYGGLSETEESLTEKDIEKIKKTVIRLEKLRTKIKVCSYAEWNRSDFIQEYNALIEEISQYGKH